MKKSNKPKENRQGGPVGTDQAIMAVITQAKMAGIPSFIFAFKDQNKPEKTPTVHWENIPTADAVNLAALAWLQSIDLDLKRHPEYAREFVQIFLDAKIDFNEIVKKVNKRVEEWRAKPNG